MTVMYGRFFFLVVVIPVLAVAQTPDMMSRVEATDAEARSGALGQRILLTEQSLVANMPFQSIGPTIMSGRIVDVDVNPADPTEMFVAYASGGLWKTSNNGMSFRPLFDREASMTIGDIAVDWSIQPRTIWVGTGENNSSRSSYAGTGVYVSRDGGDSWEHAGLEATHRIGRILLHPDDAHTVWVAALGPLYSDSEHRGVYLTVDGGTTWTQTLAGTEAAGVIDLVMHPANADELYAAMWHRERRAWNFVESGEASGMYRTDDGGETWTRLDADGFPSGAGVGRIGLAFSQQNPEILYALLDNQERRPAEDEDELPLLTKEALRDMSREAFLALDDDAIADYLSEFNINSEYEVEDVRRMVRTEELEPVHLVWYVEDANRELFDTPVRGAEVYRTEDGGASWQKMHEEPIDGLYNSYGYYFGEIRIDPLNDEHIYILGVPLLKSEDAGRTWMSIGKVNVHADHQALWINPARSGHMVNGNDGGLNITYDDGATWFKANTPAVGQFYAIAVDDAQPYRIYGGLQDNGVWGGPHTYEHSLRWHSRGEYAYESLLGGDGMQVEVDTRTNNIVYTGSQFGAYVRIDTNTGHRSSIRPRHTLGERPLRYNWQTPIHLSRHNQDVLYFGTNKVHRSFNRGTDWETLSGDLTLGGRRGDVPYGTLTSIDESPLRFGLVYVGSDDGLVHVSRDGGYSWDRVSDDLPQHRWVSRVEASVHSIDRVYVTLNGYRWDNFEALLYRSDDYGATWRKIGKDLPMEPLNVVLEDPRNADILYVGSDHGLYISLDGGDTFMAAGASLPNAPVHDLKVQDRRRHLLVGTHGRSIYRADIQFVQDLTPEILDQPVHIFAMDPVRHGAFWGRKFASWSNPIDPEEEIVYFSAVGGEVVIRVLGEDGSELNVLYDEADRGLNYVMYDVSMNDEAAAVRNEEDEGAGIEAGDNGIYYLPVGAYQIEIVLNAESATTGLEVEAGRE